MDVFIGEQKEGRWDLFVQGDSRKVVCEDLIISAGEWRGSKEYLLAEGENTAQALGTSWLEKYEKGIWRRRQWLEQEGLSRCLQGAELSLVSVGGLTTELSSLKLQKQVSEKYEKLLRFMHEHTQRWRCKERRLLSGNFACWRRTSQPNNRETFPA